jgi:hypothetical protein
MHYVVDEDARSANYDGPMETPPTLSPADKDYIVKLYSQIKPGGRASGVIRDEGGSGGVPGHGAAGQFNGGRDNTSIMGWCTLALTVGIFAVVVAVLLQRGLLPSFFGVTLPVSTLSTARPPTSSQSREPGVFRAEGENGDVNGQGTTGATPATLGSRAGKLNIDRDVRKVKRLLRPLKKAELKQLFEELGLSDSTLREQQSDGVAVYADDLVRAWILGKDGVLKSKEYPGGATWGNLKKALIELGHGIAEEIN